MFMHKMKLDKKGFRLSSLFLRPNLDLAIVKIALDFTLTTYYQLSKQLFTNKKV